MNNIIMIIAIVIALTWLATIPQVMRHKTSDGYQLRFTRKSTKVYSFISILASIVAEYFGSMQYFYLKVKKASNQFQS